MHCAVPENIHTHPMEGQWKLRGGLGISKAKIFKTLLVPYPQVGDRTGNFLKEGKEFNWNFQRGGGFKTKSLLWDGYGYFLELPILNSNKHNYLP